MSIRDFMDHFSAKIGDEVVLSAPTTSGTYALGVLQPTPTDSGTLTVRLVDPSTGELGTVILSDVPPSGQFQGENFWRVTLSGTEYVPRTYYRAEVSYSGTDAGGISGTHQHFIDDGGPTPAQALHSGTHAWMLHVNDNLSYMDTLRRSAGLAGLNVRRTDWIYRKGIPVEFKTKLYRTPADVDAAEAGTSDDFFAEYQVTITYDVRNNRTKLTSVRLP